MAHHHEILWNMWYHSMALRSPLPLLSWLRRNPHSDVPACESRHFHSSVCKTGIREAKSKCKNGTSPDLGPGSARQSNVRFFFVWESSASTCSSDLSRWVFPKRCKSFTKIPVGVCSMKDFLMYNEGDPQRQSE